MTSVIDLLKLPVKLATSASTVFGVRSGTEHPEYTVLDRVGAVEIRRYGPRVAAETDVDADESEARNVGFRRLAGYIFGGNRTRASIAMTAPVAQRRDGGQRIAMTAPVAQTTDGGRSTIRFYMPSTFDLHSLPEPDNPRVRLVPVPAEVVAVLRYTGDRSPAAVEEKRASLLRTLAGSSYQPSGEPFSWFYDPPFTVPFLRRNEVAVAVSE